MKKVNNPFYTNRIEEIELSEFLFNHQYSRHNRKFRFQVYIMKGFSCVTCGVMGTKVVIWAPHKFPNQVHADLCGIHDDGTEVMITLDHRIPRSKGGSDKIENLDPMCEPCNNKKADSLPAGAEDQLVANVRVSGRAASGFPVARLLGEDEGVHD